MVDRTSHARAYEQCGISQIRQRSYEQARLSRLLERRPLRHDVQSIVRFALMSNRALIESHAVFEDRHLKDPPELFAIFFSQFPMIAACERDYEVLQCVHLLLAALDCGSDFSVPNGRSQCTRAKAFHPLTPVLRNRFHCGGLLEAA